nr:hypothetical protein [Pseudofrankia saprophytica]
MDVEHRDQTGRDELLEDGGPGAAHTDPFLAASRQGSGAGQHIQARHVEDRHVAEVDDQQRLPRVHSMVEGGLKRGARGAGHAANVDGRDLITVRGEDPGSCRGRYDLTISDLETLSVVVRPELGKGAGPVSVAEWSQENIEEVPSILHYARQIPSDGRWLGYSGSTGGRPHADHGKTSTGIAIPRHSKRSGRLTGNVPWTITDGARA